MTIIHTKDIDLAFFPKLLLIAAELGANPAHMLCVMYSESGCSARAHNDNPKSEPPEKRYNASGLIQFMPATLIGLGWTKGHAAFRELSATDQLPYVLRYYRPYIGHLGSIGGLYTATFLPALVKHAGNRDYVLTAKAGQLPWAYAPNAAFDANHDLAITVGELEDAVTRNCKGARWNELLMRLKEEEITLPEATTKPDLESIPPVEMPSKVPVSIEHARELLARENGEESLIVHPDVPVRGHEDDEPPDAA